jgi:hypothetical protein
MVSYDRKTLIAQSTWNPKYKSTRKFYKLHHLKSHLKYFKQRNGLAY